MRKRASEEAEAEQEAVALGAKGAVGEGGINGVSGVTEGGIRGMG